MSDSLVIKAPGTAKEFEQYYHLRWLLLRAPWQQPAGSEKDELENESIHRIALLNNIIVGVGRIHFINKDKAQVRYMAVTKDFERRGIGQAILDSLEQAAKRNNRKTLILHAREYAVGFYTKQEYKTIKPSHLLFNEIQHFEMAKHLI
ncbi:MAG: GNAT family N-acetyltransferase [Gammaproteobacteria bacterium]|nr:GNAT family N-acetyltransferase [Gammaproteobacteria bacterium]